MLSEDSAPEAGRGDYRGRIGAASVVRHARSRSSMVKYSSAPPWGGSGACALGAGVPADGCRRRPRPAVPSAHDHREDLEEPFDPEDRHRRTHRYWSFPTVNRRVMPGGRLVGPSPGLPVTHSVSRSEGLRASVRRHRRILSEYGSGSCPIREPSPVSVAPTAYPAD